MTENVSPAVSLDELIADYERARDSRNRARYVITAIILIIVLAYVLLAYLEVKHFKEYQTPEFGSALASEASDMAPMVLDELNASVNRLIPLYETTFYDTIDKNQEKLIGVLLDEYQLLQTHAQSQWPEIEKALAQLVLEQEENARTSLGEYVPEDKLVDLSETYQAALTAYLNQFFEKEFGDDMQIAEDIVTKLQVLSDTQTDVTPADTQFILGMIIELLGMQMQINSAGPEALTE